MRRVDFKGKDLDLYKARGRATVTDQAVLRFLEREMGMDIAAIRELMLTDTVVQGMALGARTPSTMASMSGSPPSGAWS